MRKYFYCLTFIFILFIFPSYVRAECSYNEKVRLQKIAGNINFSYDYEEKGTLGKTTGIEFFITIANIHPDIYIRDTSRNVNYTYETNSSIYTSNDYMNGLTVIFEIYGNTENCKNELVYTKYVNLPYYNRFYSNEICKGIETYELCQKWYSNNLTYNDFIKQVKEYKESLIKKPSPDNTDEDDDGFDFEAIYQFISKYYFVILVSIIVVCLSVIFYLNKKNNFDLK